MRRLSSSWTATLSKLGFRRIRRRSKGKSKFYRRSLRIEGLEPRHLLAITVNTTIDEFNGVGAGQGTSLREAIAAASFNDHTINFDASLTGQVIELTLGQITINYDVQIVGLGADQLTINRPQTANAARLFNISAGRNVSISGVTLSGGKLTGGNSHGGAIYVNSGSSLLLENALVSGNRSEANGVSGGAIYAAGEVTIRSSMLQDNYATTRGGAIAVLGGTLYLENSTIDGNSSEAGAGIFVQSSAGESLTIVGSTISNNVATGNGGGIAFFGSSGASTATIVNTTISGNQAVSSGGVRARISTAHLTFINSTLTGNTASANGGGIGILESAKVTLYNTIVAGNNANGSGTNDLIRASSAHFDASVSSHNLIGIGNSSGLTDGQKNNQVGTASTPKHPKLTSLGDYGGPTATHLLLPDSPAIEAANSALPANLGLMFEQRGPGFPRVFGDSIDIGATEAPVRIRNGSIYIYGTPFSDEITITEDSVEIVGKGTFDVDVASASAIYVYAFDGDDEVLIDAEVLVPAWVYGGGGNDVIQGGSGNDTIEGGDGDDVIDGGAGDDVLRGGAGNDELDGGLGADVLYGDAGDDDLVGGDGPDTLFGGDGDDTLEGGNDNDQIWGGRGVDSIDGGAGDDVLFGEEGSDSIEGGEGNDVIEGGAGGDELLGGAGNDQIWGGAGDDTIHGNDGDDALFGGAGSDALYGDAGNDRLDGGGGNDELFGGIGDDVFLVSNRSAAQIAIHDESGTDTLDLSNWESIGVTLLLASGALQELDAEQEVFLQFDSTGSVENVIGTPFDDVLIGSTGANVLIGGAGNDVLFGLGGDDRLVGGLGADDLYGGPGDVVLQGGLGSDTYFIPELPYTYSVDESGAEVDTLDFSGWVHPALEELEFSWDWTGGIRLDLKEADVQTLRTLGEGQLVRLQLTDGLADGGTVERVIGTPSDDTLIGSTGDDWLEGRAGRDNLMGGGGRDVLLGQEDYDLPEVLDNADAGYSESGGVWNDATFAGGFNRGQRVVENETLAGPRSATWTFDDLAAGEYEVWVTWEPDPDDLQGGSNGATNAQFSIGTAEILLNQRQRPATLVDGVYWQRLIIDGDPNTRFTVANNTLEVDLSNTNADGRVYADAVRVVKHNFAPVFDSVFLDTPGGTTLTANERFEIEAEDCLEITFTASDSDGSLTGLNFELMGNVPAGVEFDQTGASTAELKWSATNRPQGTFAFSVKVTDDGFPPRSAIHTIFVTVGEENQPPGDVEVLDSEDEPLNIENLVFVLDEGERLELSVSATDADGVRYSLSPNAPRGAEIDPDTGAFSWEPDFQQSSTTPYQFEIRITDDGNPPLRVVLPVTVTVNDVNQDPTITAPQLVRDTGEEHDDLETADPTVHGEVTNDGSLSFVDVEVDYGYDPEEPLVFSADDIVRVESLAGMPGTGSYVFSPSIFDFPRDSVSGDLEALTIGVRAREWDPTIGTSGGYRYSEVEHITITPNLADNDPPEIILVNVAHGDTIGNVPATTDPTIRGAVTNPDGSIEGIRVKVYQTADDNYVLGPNPIGTVYTDAKGEFTFVPEGLVATGGDPLHVYLAFVAEEVSVLGTTPSVSFEFEFLFVENTAPTVEELVISLESFGTGPIVKGRVVNPYGSVAGITVEFNDDGDLNETIEGVAVSDDDGWFEYLPINMQATGSLKARALEWDPYLNELLVQDEWEECPLEPTNAPPTVTELVVRFDRHQDQSPVADPTIRGRVENDNGAEGILVELYVVRADQAPTSIFEDGRLIDVSGIAITDQDGNFEFTPLGLEPGVSYHVYAQAVEWDFSASESSELVDEEQQPVQGTNWVVLSVATSIEDLEPAITGFGLAYDTGEDDDNDVTSDPTLVGQLNYNGDPTDVLIEFDHNGDGNADGTAVLDENGFFRYVPLNLPTDQPNVLQMVRARLRIADYRVRPPEFNDTLINENGNWYLEGYDYNYETGIGGWTNESDMLDWLATILPDQSDEFVGDWYNSSFERDWNGLFSDFQTGWDYSVGFYLDLDENELPQLLADIDFAEPPDTDGQLNPTIEGVIENDGRLGGLRVDVYFVVNGDEILDGSTTTDEEGNFRYTLVGHAVGDNEVRVKVHEPRYGQSSSDVTTLGTFTLEIAENSAITIPSLLLKNGTKENDHFAATDPILVGAVHGFNNPALQTVEFDYDGDGRADGRALTNALGQFTFTSAGIGQHLDQDDFANVAARAVETRIDAESGSEYRTYGGWTSLSWRVLENQPPTITQFELAVDTGPLGSGGYRIVDRVTTDPTLVGRVSNDNGAAFLTVEFDHNKDQIVDGIAVTDENGFFRYTPQGLTLGAWDIAARVRENDPVPDTAPTWLSSGWARVSSTGVPFDETGDETFSVYYGFTLVAPLPATITLLEHPINPDLEEVNIHDPTIRGEVDDADTTANLIVEFFWDDDGTLVPLGSTTVNADGIFEFTPVGLRFGTSEITARVKEWDYSTGSYLYSDFETAPLEFSPKENFSISGEFQQTPGTLDPTVVGTVTIPSEPVSVGQQSINFALVNPLYVEVAVEIAVDNVAVTTAPIEAVLSDTGTITYRYTFRPDLPSLDESVTVKARPVGLDQYGYVFGDWSTGVSVTYFLNPPEIDEWTLEGDQSDPEDPNAALSSLTPTIQGTVSASTTSTDPAPRSPLVEFDFNGDGVMDDAVDAADDGAFTYTLSDLAPGEIVLWARAVRFETAGEPAPNDPSGRIEQIAGEWQPIKFHLLAPHIDEGSVALVNEIGEQSPPQATDPSIAGSVETYGSATAGLSVEFDHNGDGMIDGRAFVRSDATFEYTPRNVQPGDITLRMRVVDSSKIGPVASGEWFDFTFALVPFTAPSVTALSLLYEIEGSASHTSNPVLTGTVELVDSATQLVVEFDHNNDDVPDGSATANVLGEFSYTPQRLPYGSSTIRTRVVARMGDQLVLGSWDESEAITLFHRSTEPPVVSSLNADGARGVVSGRATVGGFGERVTVEVAVDSGQGPDTNGFVRSGSNGAFTYQLRTLAAAPNLTLLVRAISVDPSSGGEVVGEWRVISGFNYAPPAVGMPELIEFHLAHDTGTSATDDETADPTLVGKVTTISPGLVVEFDYDDDDVPDAEAAVLADGTFRHTIPGLEPDDEVSVRARWKQWNPATGLYEYVDDPEDAASWTELPAVEFTFKPGEDLPARVTQIALFHDLSISGLPQSTDPTFAGTIANDGRLGGLVVEFDHDGDGVFDGAAVTREDGSFLYRAAGLTPSVLQKTIFARVLEQSYSGQPVPDAPITKFTFLLTKTPLISGLAYDATAIAVRGSVLSDVAPAGLLVQYVVVEDGQEFWDDDPLLIEVDGLREFSLSAWALVGIEGGPGTVMVRGVDVSNATWVFGPWQVINFAVEADTYHPPFITEFRIVDDTGQNDNDYATHNTLLTGVVGEAGSGAYSIVEVDLDYEQDPAGEYHGELRITADANGRFTFRPDNAYLPAGVPKIIRVRPLGWDNEFNVEILGTWSAITITRLLQDAATIGDFGLKNEGSPQTDPTVKGTVVSDARVAGLRVEFDIDAPGHAADGQPDGFAYTDENGYFEFTPYGLSAGEVTIYARVVEWNGDAQAYVHGDFEDCAETFELDADGPAEPEFHADVQKNLAAAEDAFAAFREAVQFIAGETLLTGATAGALNVGIGSYRLLQRGGADTASGEIGDSSEPIFVAVELVPEDDELFDDDDDMFVDVVMPDGGMISANWFIELDIVTASEGDMINVAARLVITNLSYSRSTELEPEQTSTGVIEQRTIGLQVNGDYSFSLYADIFLDENGQFQFGKYNVYEYVDYQFERTDSLLRDVAQGGAPLDPIVTVAAGTFNGYYGSPEGTEQFGVFGDAYISQPFASHEVIEFETLLDESDTEIIEAEGASQMRSWETYEHSRYREERLSYGAISFSNDVHTATGTLQITATADFVRLHHETVEFTNAYAGGASEEGTRHSTESITYEGTLSSVTQYSAGESAQGTFNFRDALHAAFDEFGSGTADDGLGGDQSWEYELSSTLTSSAAALGTFRRERQDDGTTLARSSVSYSQANEVVLDGSGGGEGEFESAEDGTTVSGTASGTFSFHSRAALADSGVTERVNDDYLTRGHSQLEFAGWARERSEVIADIVNLDDLVDVTSAAIESLFASVSGTSRVDYTLTNEGERLEGSYTADVSAIALSAEQTFGKVAGAPVRDIDATTYLLTFSDRGRFVDDSLSAGLGAAPEHSVQGHVTRSETTLRRATNVEGVIDELLDVIEGEDGQVLGDGLAFNLSKSTFGSSRFEDYDYDEEGHVRSRRGTFTNTSQSTHESSKSVPDVELTGDFPPGSTASYSARIDGGSRASSSTTGSFSEQGDERTVNSTTRESNDNFAARQQRLTTSTNDNNGNRTGGTSTLQSKSKNSTSGEGSSSVTGPLSAFASGAGLAQNGSGTNTSGGQARASTGGTSYEVKNTPATTVNGVTTSGRSAGTSRGNTRGESNSNGTGNTQLADSARRESGSLDSNDSGRTGGSGSSTTVNKTAAGGTTTVTATAARGHEQAHSTTTGNGTFQTQFGGPLKIDLTGGATAGGQGHSGVTRTTSVHAPDSASRETVRTTLGDDGHLTTNGTTKQEDGGTSASGTYDTNQNGTNSVSVNSLSNSKADDGTFHFSRASGTLTGDTTLGADGDYVRGGEGLGAGGGNSGDGGLGAGGGSQTGNVNLTGDSKLDATGTSGSFQWSPIMEGETQIGATWNGTLIKSSDTGGGTNTRTGNDLKIDPAGNVTGTLDESEDGDGTQTTSILVWGGSYETLSENSRHETSNRRLDTYTTTTKNTPAIEQEPATRSSTDVHAWLEANRDEEITVTSGTASGETYHNENRVGTSGSKTGISTQTVTLAGDQASAGITSQSSTVEDEYDKNRYTSTAAGVYQEQIDIDLDRTETTASSNYFSQHTVDARGLAQGGTFNANSDWEQTKSNIVETSHLLDRDDPGMGTSLWDYSYIVNAQPSAPAVTVRRHVEESGSYEDVALPIVGVLRLQWGKYHQEDTTQEWNSLSRTYDEYYAGFGSAAGRFTEEEERIDDTVRVITDGWYTPFPFVGGETKQLTRDKTHRSNTEEHQRWLSPFDYDDFWRDEINIHTAADGQTTGHQHTEWRQIQNTVPEGVLDEDLFASTTPPPPPKSPPPVTNKTPTKADSLFLSVSDVSPPKPKPSLGEGVFSVPMDTLEAETAAPEAKQNRATDGEWTLWTIISSPIRSLREISRGAELDRIIEERMLKEAEKEMALNPGSDAGLRGLQSLQEKQRRRAAAEATELAEKAVEFNAQGFGGGFVRPNGGNFGKPRSFSSFSSLKRELGSAGEGNVWHHIVEQRSSNITRFGAEAIHNTNNVVPVTRGVNQAIADYYSSKRRFTGGQTVRQWLDSKSFEEQAEFGRETLKKVLLGKPLP